jgi:hypothetical protein
VDVHLGPVDPGPGQGSRGREVTNGLRGLLHGVNAGGCGTPWSSIANLIGAQLFAREGGDVRRYWRRFLPLSGILLVLMVLVSLALVSL